MTNAVRIASCSLTSTRARVATPQLHDNFLSPKHQDCLAALAENTSL